MILRMVLPAGFEDVTTFRLPGFSISKDGNVIFGFAHGVQLLRVNIVMRFVNSIF